MADLKRGNPSFIINPNPWDPNSPFGPLGGPNPYYRGPIQAHVVEDEPYDPYPRDDPVTWSRRWGRVTGDVVDRLGRYFGRDPGPVVTPQPLLRLKRITFSDEKWKKLAKDFFAKYGEPTAADNQRLMSCELTPRQWLQLGIRRIRAELEAAVAAADAAISTAPVGPPAQEQPLWDALERAQRALNEFNAQAQELLDHSANIEAQTGAAPDNR